MHVLLSKIRSPRLRLLVTILSYSAILAAVIFLQTRGNYTSPPFIYQGF